jgi:hypothetical protein
MLQAKLRSGRWAMAKGKNRYTALPQVPAELGVRLETVLEVIAGRVTVSEGARLLGMSRNHFQSLLHRGLAGMVDSITPKPAGRPARPREVNELQARVERLERENTRLQERVETTDRLLQAASGLLQGRIRPARQVRTRKTRTGSDEDAGDGEPRLREVERMRRLGLTAACAAAIAGVHPSTARRWKQRASRPKAPAARSKCTPEAARQVDRLVRSLHGQVGAESLRHSVPGISRRQAACVKAATLTCMERERKAALTRVWFTIPGAVRGFDGMHLHCAQGIRHALITADAAVPYRTGVHVAARYDADLVTRAISEDIERHGAPLVYRMDRAKAHEAGPVRELLAAHRVLVLHGPPRCPRYYGQLERQNREHRAWDDELARLDEEELRARLAGMLDAVNTTWRRRTLRWKTASEVWNERPLLEIDREAWIDDVNVRAVHIGRELQRRGQPVDLAQRLAIEQALENRGFLRRTIGGWC